MTMKQWVRAFVTRPLQWADCHPATTVILLAAAAFVGLRVWSALASEPVLLARVDPQIRGDLYAQFAATGVAVLGIALTVLAILMALPDRPQVEDIRRSDAWPNLRDLLLMVAAFALIALVGSHLGSAVDTSQKGIEWIEQVVLAAGVVCFVAMAVAGGTFALLLRRANEPVDPSRGRGQGIPRCPSE